MNLNNSRVSLHASPIIFTLNGEGFDNPRSRWLILDIKHMGTGCRALVLKSISEVKKLRRSGAGMVPIYDTDCVGALVFERLRKEPINPSWARRLSTGLCFGVCLPCIECASNRTAGARKIVETVTRHYDVLVAASQSQKEIYRRPPLFMRAQRPF